jgi:hypothetical protein
MSGSNYIPQVGNYNMATQPTGYNPNLGTRIGGSSSSSIPSMKKLATVPPVEKIETVGENKRTALTNADGSLTTLGIASVGMGALESVGNLWSAWENNKLAKKQFAFNKDMATKNYALAKDAYERRVRRSDNLTRAQSGEDMQSIYKDQARYNRERTDARKDY